MATGFTPDALAVAPLHVGGGVAGVLSVLDAAPRGRIETLGVIVALAGHAAAGLRLAGDLDRIGPG